MPINWHFTAEEAGYMIRDCGAGVIVIHADLLPQIAEGIPADVSVLVVPTPPETRAAYEISPDRCGVPEDSIEWNAWLDGYTPWENNPLQASAGEYHLYLGTTGRPKGVRRQPPMQETQQVLADMLAASSIFARVLGCAR